MGTKKCNCILNILKKADIFAVGVGFNVKDNNKEFGTAFGGIVFICYLILCLYFIITNFFDFADRSIFNQNIMETKSDTAPPLNLLNSKMAFALTITINGSPNDSVEMVLVLLLIALQKYNNN